VPRFVDNQQMVQRFIQEARATLRLTHTHIARTHTIFQDRGTYYLAMEYLAGGSLADRLGAGPLPVEEGVRIATDLCRALACAHEEGIVHCDVKPANVLFDERGRVHLADFGIAHLSAEVMTRQFLTATGTAMGTILYMAPEQLEGVRDDPRVDIYALGALLYEMVAGQPYVDFDRESTPLAQSNNIQLIRTQAPRPLRSVNPDLPGWLAQAVDRALRKAARDRFATAEELRAALQRKVQREAKWEPLPPTQLVPDRECEPALAKKRVEELPSVPLPAEDLSREQPRGAAPHWIDNIPNWGWALGGLVALALLIAGGMWVQRLLGEFPASLPRAPSTLRPSATLAEPAPTSKPTHTFEERESSPTLVATATARQAPPPEPSPLGAPADGPEGLDVELRYLSFLGGSEDDRLLAAAVDSMGNIYVTGQTSSGDFSITAGAYDEALTGDSEVFVSVLDPTLSTVRYSTFLGGSEGEYARAIAVDSAGNVYVIGTTSSGDFLTTAGAYDGALSGSEDTFVSVLDPTLSTLRYSTLLGGSGRDWSSAIALDSAGNVHVTGQTWSSDFPITAGAYDEALTGDSEVFVSVLNPTLSTLHHSTFLGGDSDDCAFAIALDSAGNVYVSGQTKSSDFPTTAGVHDGTFNGGEDAFVSVLNPTLSNLRYCTVLGGSERDGTSAITVDSAGNVWAAGFTQSANFPTTAGAYDEAHGGALDAFVSTLDPTLSTLRYCTVLGGSDYDGAGAIALDSAGNVWVAGSTQSSNFPTTAGAHDEAYNGNGDAFVSVLDPTVSSLRYSTFLGGGSQEWATCDLDGAGNVYVAGGTLSDDLHGTTGAHDKTYSGGEDIFVGLLETTRPPR
jgi:serine/threonine protein kinase